MFNSPTSSFRIICSQVLELCAEDRLDVCGSSTFEVVAGVVYCVVVLLQKNAWVIYQEENFCPLLLLAAISCFFFLSVSFLA
jgi:hypothetical protein